MQLPQLERERAVLMATARKTNNPRQKAALEHQVRQLEHELGKKRGEGFKAMIAAAGNGCLSAREEGELLPAQSSARDTRGASQVTQLGFVSLSLMDYAFVENGT
jgi:hypothetical protein